MDYVNILPETEKDQALLLRGLIEEYPKEFQAFLNKVLAYNVNYYTVEQ